MGSATLREAGFLFPPSARMRTGSMGKSAPTGSTVEFTPLPGPVSAGDVVLLVSGGGLVVHRVVLVRESAAGAVVFHRGDAARRVRAVRSTHVLARALVRDLNELPGPARLGFHAQALAVRWDLALRDSPARGPYRAVRRTIRRTRRSLARLTRPIRTALATTAR